MKPLHSPKQRGITLFEALVSLVILALGVLGLAAVQARMLVETRTTNARAAAVRLIGELNERVQLNTQGAIPTGTPAVSPYADGSGVPATATTFPGVVAASLALNCPALGCSAANQALYDIADWRDRVSKALPGGVASVWQISPRQLQIVIAWQANENTQAVLNNSAAPADTQQVSTTMQITGTGAGTQCGGASGLICHIDFIDIPLGQ